MRYQNNIERSSIDSEADGRNDFRKNNRPGRETAHALYIYIDWGRQSGLHSGSNTVEYTWCDKRAVGSWRGTLFNIYMVMHATDDEVVRLTG